MTKTLWSLASPFESGKNVRRTTEDEVRHLASCGHSEHVRVLFAKLTPEERERCADPDVLRQVVVGTVRRLRAVPAAITTPAELEHERAFLDAVVQLFVKECRARRVFPHDLFRSLLDCADERTRASRLREAAEACDLALTLGVQAYPDLWPWVRWRLAQVQTLLGETDAAYATLSETYRRLDRIADRKAVPALLASLGAAALQTRRAPQFKRLLIERLGTFHTDADERRAALDLLRRTHRGMLRLATSHELAAADKLLWLWCWLCLGAARHVPGPRLARVMERSAAAGAYVRQYGWRGISGRSTTVTDATRSTDVTLVTRAMGGIGDLLMMTPGLHALKTQHPTRPVVLAIPQRFFPVFEGNTDVQLLDLDDDFDPRAYKEWINLTDCPAARIESRTAPAVKANRIELFARALGVHGSRLATLGRPRYVVSDTERQWGSRFFAAHHLTGATVIGVQARTGESYRNVPHVDLVVSALARHAKVVVFGAVFRANPTGSQDTVPPGVVQVDGLTLRQAFALASRCTALVTPDSAFLHLAGALDLPCVALFGPTDGRVRARDYPSVVTLDARRVLRCVPCWRNDATPCALTGLRPSACLGEIDPDAVVRAVLSVVSARRPAHGSTDERTG